MAKCKFRVACAQFEPTLSDVDSSIQTCEELLNENEAALLKKDDGDGPLGVMMFPELAFTGYTFDSREDIEKLVEYDDETNAKTFCFLRKIAARFDCLVACGYIRGVREDEIEGRPRIFNAMQVVDSKEKLVLRINKHHLYCLDESWADEDTNGFTSSTLRVKAKGMDDVVHFFSIPTTFGICMDINPYRFEAPWDAFEFANHILKEKSSLVLFSSAWTNAHPDDSDDVKEVVPPALDTWNYWISRLFPLLQNNDVPQRACVFANRIGMENKIHFVGSSIVFEIQDAGKEERDFEKTIAVRGTLDNSSAGILIASVSC